MDQGTFGDKEIGHCSVAMDELKVGSGVSKSFTLLFENKDAGKIHITSEYTEPEKKAELAPREAPAKAAPAIARPQPAMQPTPAPMPMAAPTPQYPQQQQQMMMRQP